MSGLLVLAIFVAVLIIAARVFLRGAGLWPTARQQDTTLGFRDPARCDPEREDRAGLASPPARF